ncbi:MAG: CCA tRNA nucleotidyltransferase [Thermoleophilia bacterium]|nr:CCA tRNA nucleotidyltransferase [Thermoleophilia bacterium]
MTDPTEQRGDDDHQHVEPTGNAADAGAAILARAPRVQLLLARLRESKLALDGVYLVGGAVRDAILGRDTGPDLDLAVEGDAPAFAHLLASATGGEVVAEHDAFGTATVIADLGDGAPTSIDVAGCRTETYEAPGALPTVALGATIDRDLARRDVTVNAIAIALAPGPDGAHRTVDPFDGIGDLGHGVLRFLHEFSFVDDPTRIVRVARYAGRLHMRVSEDTRQRAVDAIHGGAFTKISADRLRAELVLVLQEQCWKSLTLLASWGLLERLDPRLDRVFEAPYLLLQLDRACGDSLELNQRSWPLRLAALVQPLGSDAAGWMGWLGFPGDVVNVVLDHLRLLDAVLARPDELRAMKPSELYVELGEPADDSLALAALAIGDDDPALLDHLVTFATTARDARLHVRGQDVIDAGIPAGPRVGRVLGDLFLRTLDGELCGEDDERRAIAEHVAKGTD